MNSLTPIQRQRKVEMEAIIDANHQQANDWYDAVLVMKTEKLYREDFETWENYCEAKLNKTPQYVNRVLAALKSPKLLGENKKSETKVHFLESDAEEKEPEKKGSVTVESKPEPAAKPIKQAVASVSAPTVEAVQLDEVGRKIPHHLVAEFNRGDEIKAIRRQISKMRCDFKRSCDAMDMLYADVSAHSLTSALDAAYRCYEDAIPFALCSTCNGQNSKACKSCHKRGWMCAHSYDRYTPPEIKAMHKLQAAKVNGSK